MSRTAAQRSRSCERASLCLTRQVARRVPAYGSPRGPPEFMGSIRVHAGRDGAMRVDTRPCRSRRGHAGRDGAMRVESADLRAAGPHDQPPSRSTAIAINRHREANRPSARGVPLAATAAFDRHATDGRSSGRVARSSVWLRRGAQCLVWNTLIIQCSPWGARWSPLRAAVSAAGGCGHRIAASSTRHQSMFRGPRGSPVSVAQFREGLQFCRASGVRRASPCSLMASPLRSDGVDVLALRAARALIRRSNPMRSR